MKSFYYYLLIAVVFAGIGWFANTAWHLPREINPIAEIKPRPLDRYTIDNLAASIAPPAQIELGDVIKDYPQFTSYKYFMSFDPALGTGAKKRVSGMLNIPKGKGTYPLIVMFRGYVDHDSYFTGEGTVRAAEYFAKNGFITIAPDFLGYGESDNEASNTFEARFQTHTTALTTIESAGEVSNWDKKNLFIWAHSNGGQIALETLEVTGKDYPTVLWAPVSKPFPYSILFFTDSPDDYGKSLRHALAKFEEDYDTDLYSIHKYFDRIKAPIQLNQGGKDENVPQSWSDLLAKTLKDIGTDIKYIVYPADDHNMRPSWQTVVGKNLIFFKSNLK